MIFHPRTSYSFKYHATSYLRIRKIEIFLIRHLFLWALIVRKNTKIALIPFEGEKWFSLNVMQFLRSQNVICCRMYDLHNYCDTLKLYHQVKFSFSFELIIHLKSSLVEIYVMKQKQMLRNEQIPAEKKPTLSTWVSTARHKEKMLALKCLWWDHPFRKRLVNAFT